MLKRRESAMAKEMTERENMLAILHGEQPEYYGDIFKTMVFAPDPIFASDSIVDDGKIHHDSWGTPLRKLPGAVGKHPVINDENAVVKDITKWREQLKVPTLKGLDWSKAEAGAAAVDRSQKFVAHFCAQGLFERSHFLMGMEPAFMAYMEEPEAMAEMLRAICDYKKEAIKEVSRHIHTDIVFFQDDWGSKQNLFLPPSIWRELIKPLQQEISDTIHEIGALYMHHADCICEPLAQDMVDLGIDIWQGAIPQNDIVAVQERTNGQLAMQGGIDGPMLDQDGATDEQIIAEVHRAIETYCPRGRFFPGTAAPLFHVERQALVDSETIAYGSKFAQEHPIG